ncbi:MAG: hypothetical protein FWC28_04905 [Proteobacteria bacterium]|nr:hypothetical protein [Cystobacterineae bacterium]MCL2259145.1 hypothetical protein [Cystobacterineae bacterium]MCL2314576.1 hypothetical protein [Pseudomonadota bacterium]
MPLYSEHRTVSAALALEATTSRELEAGARQRRIEALMREAHAPKRAGGAFAQLLESKAVPKSEGFPPK